MMIEYQEPISSTTDTDQGIGDMSNQKLTPDINQGGIDTANQKSTSSMTDAGQGKYQHNILIVLFQFLIGRCGQWQCPREQKHKGGAKQQQQQQHRWAIILLC